MKKTKIICTVGPASRDVETLKELMKSGMDIARLNFSHGDFKEHGENIEMIKKARSEVDKQIPIMLDTGGPEIRTGYVEGHEEDSSATIKLKEGEEVTLVGDYKNTKPEGEKSTSERIYVSYEGLAEDVQEGERILIDDGKLELKALDIEGKEIRTKVVNGGRIKSRRGVNVPDSKINLPTVTEDDQKAIKFGIKQGIDFISLSFVRRAENVKNARKLLDENGGEHVKIISKVEDKEGVENLDGILDESEGIMIARGDLGVEIELSKVPKVQKRMINQSLEKGKIVITATEMLDSMEEGKVPTRAEVSDVYNAVRQSTTCVMLSGETANGENPVEAVKTMRRIIEKSENGEDKKNPYNPPGDIANSVCSAVNKNARELQASAIVAYSDSGSTAKNMSSLRPNVPVVLISPDERVLRQSQMLYGVVPYRKESKEENFEQLYKDAEEVVKKVGLASDGDKIVVVSGTPIGVKGITNTIRAAIVGEDLQPNN